MKLSNVQIIGLIVIAAVATTTITIFVVLDPFAPEYTLTINEPTESGCGGGNVTISPDKTYTIVGKDSRQFLYKRGTVVTLTINTRPGFALYIHPWEGPDAASVVTVTANVTYTITITKDMNITVAWYVYCT